MVTSSLAGAADPQHPDDDHSPGERDWDAEAKAQGWKPFPADPTSPLPHEYRGDPARWTDSRTFVLRGEDALPVLRETVRRITEKNVRQEKEIEGLKKTLTENTAAIADLLDLAKSERASGYKQARRELEAKQREALRNGDEASFDQITEGLKEIDADQAKVEKIGVKPAPAAAPQEGQVQDPDIAAFISANGWFSTDNFLRQQMISEHLLVIRKHPGMGEAKRLEMALKTLQQKFPDAFGITPAAAPEPEEPEEVDETPAPRRHVSAVATPRDLGEPRPGRSPFERIRDPEDRAEAKAAFPRMQRHDPGLTEAEYVEMFLNPSADIIEVQKKFRSKK